MPHWMLFPFFTLTLAWMPYFSCVGLFYFISESKNSAASQNQATLYLAYTIEF